MINCISVESRILSAAQKQILRDAVRNTGKPVFVHYGVGLSDEKHGHLFVVEHDEVRCFQTTLAKARTIVKRAAA
jgi:hypothetical protein